MYDIKVTIPNT